MLIEIPFMSAIFGIFTQFINGHMKIYSNLTPNITKGQIKGSKGSKIGPKQDRNRSKRVKILKAPRNAIFHNFLYNIHEPYRIHYFNHTHVIRGY